MMSEDDLAARRLAGHRPPAGRGAAARAGASRCGSGSCVALRPPTAEEQADHRPVRGGGGRARRPQVRRGRGAASRRCSPLWPGRPRRAPLPRRDRGRPACRPPLFQGLASTPHHEVCAARWQLIDFTVSPHAHMGAEDTLFQRFGKEFPKGTVLFHEGEPGKEMFVLQSGRVVDHQEGPGRGEDPGHARARRVLRRDGDHLQPAAQRHGHGRRAGARSWSSTPRRSRG